MFITSVAVLCINCEGYIVCDEVEQLSSKDVEGSISSAIFLAVSCQLLKVEAGVQSQASLCGIYG